MSRVIIVGAGVLGAAIGWRLAKAGHGVTLIDPTPGGQASPGSFAWLNASMAEDPEYNLLRHQSLEIWRSMKQADPSVPIEFAGAILWEQDHFDLNAIAASHDKLGRPTSWLDGPATAAREPAVKALPDRALFAEGDGYGDPVAITRWFLDQAQAAGATLRAGEEVREVLVHDGRVTGARTDARGIDADHVIFAAGIRLSEMLDRLKLRMAMDNQAGLLARTSAGTGAISSMLATPGVHVWQGADGGYLFGADFGGGDTIEDPHQCAAQVLKELRSVLAGTDDCEIESITVRERPMPADGRPAIGAFGPEGLYVVCTHSGMTLAPVIAEMVTREIGDGQEDPRLAPYRPGRASLAAGTAP